MKTSHLILILLTGLALGFAGCGNKSGVNTSNLTKSFKTAEADVRAGVDKAVSAIKASDYNGALAALQETASKAKLTPEQQKALQDVIEQVKAKIAEMAGKAAEGANKAIGDLQKSLPK